MESVSGSNLCANCGKGEEESGNLKSCAACKLVKYCSRDCQIAHRPQHKKACKKRAAELYDEKLFKEVELKDCPICFQPLLGQNLTEMFQSCCGKRICIGCIYAMEESEGKDLCAFCRTPPATSNAGCIQGVKKLMDKGNGEAFFEFANYYANGMMGLLQDMNKANELYLKAGELGCAEAYFNLGNSYDQGLGVEVDKKTAQYYWELSAMSGSVQARHNLGACEYEAGNVQRAKKHMIIAARAGENDSLNCVKDGFTRGIITKDEYASTLRAYHERQKEMKSDARDKAALFRVAMQAGLLE